MDNYLNILAIAISILTSLIAVGLHFEILDHLTRWIQGRSTRVKVYLTVICILIAHLIEIHVYALVYGLMSLVPDFGTITPANSSFDYIYYSAVVYTTVGFGDIVPTGSMRVLTAVESLIGLVLITWSATFIYVNRSTKEIPPANTSAQDKPNNVE